MDGIIVINKPTGITSSRAVQITRRLFSGLKAGHTGTLDPMASGVLPVCLGRATRMAEYVVGLPKRYRAEIVLGKVSDTGDAEGRIETQAEVPHLERRQVEELLLKFKGEIKQLSPQYSAVKYRGKPLYHWTRKGKEVPRKPRIATIYELDLIDINPDHEPHLIIDVQCSKGTYIRTLAADIGHAFGCGGYLSALVRSVVGPYRLEEAVSFDQAAEMIELGKIEDIVQPMDTAVLHFPHIYLDYRQIEQLKNGLIFKPDDQELIREYNPKTPIRVYDQQKNFKALASKIEVDGRFALKTTKFLAH